MPGSVFILAFQVPDRETRLNEKKRLGSCRKTLGSNPASNPKSMRSSLKTRI